MTPYPMLSRLAGMALLLAPAMAMAADVSRFGPDEPMTLAELRPHPSDAEWYKESWNHNAWTADGHFVAVDFTLSNIGIGDNKAGYKAMLKRPDGQRIKCKAELDAEDVSHAADGFGLDFGKVRVAGTLKALDVTVRCKNLEMDLRFTNQGRAYKPGNGLLRFDDRGHYRKLYPQPRSRVSGEIRSGGRSLQLDAPGLVSYSSFDIAPHVYSRRWFRFRHVSERLTIILTELETPVEFGGTRRGWVLIHDGQRRRLATTRASFQFDGYIRDKRSEEGYRIPRRVRLAATDGETHLTGSLIMTDVEKSEDPTADWNPVVRTLARQYSKPREYRIGCRYQLRLKSTDADETLEGESAFRFGYVNP